jgi:hypothetical protein
LVAREEKIKVRGLLPLNQRTIQGWGPRLARFLSSTEYP